tara:strand:- start:748 stop:1212 length:465 start_codon:yes stop_codon:yes gene_type:complete
MKKILILFITLFISSCTINKVEKTHGVPYLNEKREKLYINKSNKNDILDLLGPPSTKGNFENDVWIYIERQKTVKKIYNLGQSKLVKNNVLILEINEMGLLAKKNFLDINEMNKIDFSDKSTVSQYEKNSFVYSFLSSMRQRLNDPLGKRKKAK